FEMVVRRSTDGGASFAPAAVVQSLSNPLIFGNMAVDNLGRVDVVFSTDSDANNGLDQLSYSRSSDGGQTFSEPVEVASTAGTGTFLITALRHDSAGRLYIQFFETADLSVATGTLSLRTAE
ncbi:MAG TPA: sialidase family protein, partial [bacterium]|nr:sialidase family protein [bacterium]